MHGSAHRQNLLKDCRDFRAFLNLHVIAPAAGGFMAIFEGELGDS
jgi:hypothetical protein